MYVVLHSIQYYIYIHIYNRIEKRQADRQRGGERVSRLIDKPERFTRDYYDRPAGYHSKIADGSTKRSSLIIVVYNKEGNSFWINGVTKGYLSVYRISITGVTAMGPSTRRYTTAISNIQCTDVKIALL